MADVPTNERLLAIAVDGEAMASDRRTRLESDRRYYADVAAACRALIAVREVQQRCAARAKLHAMEHGFMAHGQAHAFNDCAVELAAILGPSTGAPHE